MDLLGAPDPRAVADLPPDLLDELLTVATEVAVACGRLVVDERPERVSVAAPKTSAIDIVTVVDRRSLPAPEASVPSAEMTFASVSVLKESEVVMGSSLSTAEALKDSP